MIAGAARLAVADDVIAGLRAPVKHLPCRLLYDAHGAALFEAICEQPEYYPARDEHALLAAHLPAIARALGARLRVIEPGSGSGGKTRRLLAALDHPASYVAIDVSREQLSATARALRREFPGVEVQPVHGDFTHATLPAPRAAFRRTLVFFPGSTIGNFEPDAARTFLARFHHLAGPDGALLLGADANQDRASLVRAYDDALGVTAAFDLNVLAHVNRTHRATFDLSQFAHHACWNSARSRVEMHLISRVQQNVAVAGEAFALSRGEPIVTEHCYKHAPGAMHALLTAAGWRVAEVYTGAHARMRLWLALAR